MSDYNIAKFHGIQYSALRIIFKKPLKYSNTVLHELGKLEPIKIRLKHLAKNYLEKAIENDKSPLNLIRN